MDTDTDFRATDMTVDEYMNQRDFWLDDKAWQLVPIDSLTTQRRLYAARALVRNATALISLTENEHNRNRNLVRVMSLINVSPQEWVKRTPLYGALYRDEREPVSVVPNGGPDITVRFAGPHPE